MALGPGLEAEAAFTVGEEHTAVALRSGDVPVLATPMVVALCEEASVAAVAPYLDAGDTTVGVRVTIEHMAPSVAGSEVSARARLMSVEGRTLRFEATVIDAGRVVATATIDRVVVDRERFLAGTR